jgi:hypothetical protein
MMPVRGDGGVAQADKQQRLVTTIHQRVNGFAEHRAAKSITMKG